MALTGRDIQRLVETRADLPPAPAPPQQDINVLESTLEAHIDLEELLEQTFEQLRHGNCSTVKILELYWDASDMALRYVVRIRFCHRAARWLPKTSVTVYARGSFNPFRPDPADMRICVDSPIGQLCITLADVVRYIALMLA